MSSTVASWVRFLPFTELVMDILLTYERNLIVLPLSAARTALWPVHFNRYLADVSQIEFKARHIR